jgi:hypothetical protein
LRRTTCTLFGSFILAGLQEKNIATQQHTAKVIRIIPKFREKMLCKVRTQLPFIKS